MINGTVHFPKQLLTNIAMLQFNPGGSLTSGTWIGWGLTIMCYIPYKPGIWGKIRAEEDAAKATATTQTFPRNSSKPRVHSACPLAPMVNSVWHLTRSVLSFGCCVAANAITTKRLWNYA